MRMVLQSAAVFVALLAILRVMGKRELAQMSAFELVILFLVGDITAEAIVSEDTSLIGALTATSVFALLTVLVAWAAWRFRALRPLLDGTPSAIVRNGVPDRRAMSRERVTSDDLAEAARLHGLSSIDEVTLAVLERNGGFSFLTAARPPRHASLRGPRPIRPSRRREIHDRAE